MPKRKKTLPVPFGLEEESAFAFDPHGPAVMARGQSSSGGDFLMLHGDLSIRLFRQNHPTVRVPIRELARLMLAVTDDPEDDPADVGFAYPIPLPDDHEEVGDCPHANIMTYTEDGVRYKACRDCKKIWPFDDPDGA